MEMDQQWYLASALLHSATPRIKYSYARVIIVKHGFCSYFYIGYSFPHEFVDGLAKRDDKGER